MNNYYIYAHVNATTGTIFYIGKGKTYRAKSLHRRSERWHNYVKKYGYTIMYIEENLTQEESFVGEVHYIKAFGRKDLRTGELINMSDGGVGGNNNVGRVFSEEWRRKLGESGRRRKGVKKKPHSEETKKKISNKLMGRPATWLKGKKVTPETGIVCQHCDKLTDRGNYSQFHGDKCKHNPNGVRYTYRRSRGEKNHASKISDQNAIEIKELYANQPNKSKKQIMEELSKRYGVSTHTVRHIGTGARRSKEPISKEPRIHPSTKLTVDIVRAIRDEYSLGGVTQARLGIKYGVGHTTIGEIIHNKAWKLVA